MNLRASLLYARKLIFSRDKASKSNHGKKSLFGAMLCIALSLIPLVTVLVVSDGMVQGMTSRIIGLSSGHIEVRFFARSKVLRDYDKFIQTQEQIKQVDGVTQAFAEIQGTALAAGMNGRTGATVRGVSPSIFEDNTEYSRLFTVVEGSTDLSENNFCIIGEYLAKNLNLHAGENIRIINVAFGANNKVMPRFVTYKISGIVSSGYQELDALWVFIPIKKAFETMSVNSAAYQIQVFTKDAFSTELYRVRQNLRDEITGYGKGEVIDAANAYVWQELNSSQFENFSSTQVLLLLIMLLVVLVASVNIASALVMLVMERKKEIAILKSTGASSRGIALSFIITGMACGAGGVLIGLPLGLLAAVNINPLIRFAEKLVNLVAKFFYVLSTHSAQSFSEIHLLDPAYYIQSISVNVPFWKLLVIVLGTMILSLVVSAIPAIRAGKQKPIETLRKI